jgi:uncharacterized protein (TIGR02246 family)
LLCRLLGGKHGMRSFLVVVLMALTTACAGMPASTSNSNSGEARSPTPESVVDGFIAAWNSHDPKAFEPLYTTDAVWVPVAEERTKGQAAIVSEFAKIHTGNGWANQIGLAKLGVPEVRFLRPDVATIFFHVDMLVGGKPVPELRRALILVATLEHGIWKIAAGQLTKESGS